MSRLTNAPLQEVIFELRWELQVDEKSNNLMDKGFELALGAFGRIIKNYFPEVVKKASADLPMQVLQYQPIYQFWSQGHSWPVIQLGPGIMTVNETDENYDWNEMFFPLIKNAIEWLNEAYDSKLNITVASLKYIDTIKIDDYNFDDWNGFINENFAFNFHNKFENSQRLKKFSFSQIFEIENKSNLHLTISNGKNKKNQEVLIWQSAITSNNEQSVSDIVNWIDFAHIKTSELFKNITKKEFYASFNS
jgi:uncharacterized protein (TIGR04255 family)